MNRRQSIAVIVVVLAIVFSLLYACKRAFHLFKTFPEGYLDDKRQLIELLVEAIIPETDTPGAGSAGVSEFVIDKVNLFLTKNEATGFYIGLEEVDALGIKKFGKSFSVCSQEQREQVLNAMETREWERGSLPFRIKRKLFGRSFIDILKTFTVEGYCISKSGCVDGLAYDPVPVHYVPCIDLKPGQRSWATK